MTLWTTPAHKLLEAQADALAEALREIDPGDLERRYSTTLAGDERKLRGIPAIGRGVTGAIPGTRPGDRISL